MVVQETDIPRQDVSQETLEEIFADLDAMREDFITRHGQGPEAFIPPSRIPMRDRFLRGKHNFTPDDEALIFLCFVLRATPEEREGTKKELEILLVDEDEHLVQPLLRIFNAVQREKAA